MTKNEDLLFRCLEALESDVNEVTRLIFMGATPSSDLVSTLKINLNLSHKYAPDCGTDEQKKKLGILKQRITNLKRASLERGITALNPLEVTP